MLRNRTEYERTKRHFRNGIPLEIELEVKEFEDICNGKADLTPLSELEPWGELLKQWRIQKRWSIEELAEALEIDTTQLIAYESTNFKDCLFGKMKDIASVMSYRTPNKPTAENDPIETNPNEHNLMPLENIYEWSTLLLKWRLAKHWTQGELGERLDTYIICILAYEKNSYSHCVFSEMLKIKDILETEKPEEPYNEMEDPAWDNPIIKQERMMGLIGLPEKVENLLKEHNAPLLLVAHLRLVHDAASKLTYGIHRAFPRIFFDLEAVLFGAATHDIGKIVHPEELTEFGSEHETAGKDLLTKAGYPDRFSRFALTHGGPRREPNPTIEDLLVQIADAVWKGKRHEETEKALIKKISAECEMPEWEVFSHLDDILTEIAHGSDSRLAYQNSVQNLS